MTISTAPISPAFELPDEEAAMRALVRAAVLLTGAAAAIAAVLGVVHTVLAVAGADRAAAVAPAFSFAVGVWGAVQAVTVLMLGMAFAQRPRLAMLTWMTALLSGVLSVTAFLHASATVSGGVLATAAGLFAIVFVLWLGVAVRAGVRSGALGSGMHAFALVLIAVGSFALGLAFVAGLAAPGSRLQEITSALAAGPGVVAWLAMPVWWLVAAFRLFPTR
ncbi:MAG TPA: hypothetical protein VFY91_08335 [Microbacterium sp.]|nr:hypothetical protein [Microbacterium sp.]